MLVRLIPAQRPDSRLHNCTHVVPEHVPGMETIVPCWVTLGREDVHTLKMPHCRAAQESHGSMRSRVDRFLFATMWTSTFCSDEDMSSQAFETDGPSLPEQDPLWGAL
mmetsp:Transcript_62641/g.189080  ORF Transcript_62641/g.189080 Transcript_62641/m.189080 type:complete len:108 (-) Transcript_62641:60-383(-)